MFSWIDYFNNENNEDNNIKLLKKSELCQNKNKKMKNCHEGKKIFKKKKINEKVESNNKSKNENLKKCSKILDLSPEEKEKIAALIRELGVLQSAKEKVSLELCKERQKFQDELSSIEKMYKTTLEDKERLEDELQKANETFKSLDFKEVNDSRKESKYVDDMTKFVVVPKVALRNIEDFSDSFKTREFYFPGPPSSSRSQKITSDLLRSHSSQSGDLARVSDCNYLMKEQKELLIERKYLNIVLKQDKCLRKLKSKISKLEKESSVNNMCETSSTMTDPVELVTPRILNQISSEENSIAQSISLSNSNVSTPKHSPSPPYKDSALLRNEDVLLITALNHGVVDEYSSSRSYIRPGSATDAASLLHMINTIDQDHILDHGKTCSDHSSSEAPSEDDLLNDLFFRL